MKLKKQFGWWVCEFTNYRGDKQIVVHADSLTAMQVAFINKKNRFLS